MEEDILRRQLEEYAQGGPYPLHMPGHKRRLSPGPGLPYEWDVTEVPGTDDLHDADGILAQAMVRTAALCGARRTWYLVGGSTVGILAGIRALAPWGSTVVCARNCHKSVYHALELGNLSAEWLAPEADEAFGIYGSILPQAVEAALDRRPEAKCVILTSPTFEGVLSDVRTIANLCHRRGVALLVDEAHGAHLGLFPGFPDGAVRAGADVVIQSAHKTLPSLTQTAWLHLAGPLAEEDELERQLDVFETSSPSYPLLASLDGCTGLLLHRGRALFEAWTDRLDRFNKAAADLERLRLLGDRPSFFARDPSKLLVNCRGTQFTGTSLAEALRLRFGFEVEMACGENLLAMTSPADSDEALERFSEALHCLDRECHTVSGAGSQALPSPGETRCTIAQALVCPAEQVSADRALGRTAAEYVWAYPPGVPLLVPGEEITASYLEAADRLERQGTRLRHSGKKPGYRCLCQSGSAAF